MGSLLPAPPGKDNKLTAKIRHQRQTVNRQLLSKRLSRQFIMALPHGSRSILVRRKGLDCDRYSV